jgi:Xaa-Pro aminopeptidase
MSFARRQLSARIAIVLASVGMLITASPRSAISQQRVLFGQSREEFAQRRAEVRKAAGNAIVIIKGPTEAPDIERSRFRTDNNLLYLTGVEASGAMLVLLPDGDPSGKTAILFLPAVSPGMAAWVDPVPGPGSETESNTGIDAVMDVRNAWATLKPSIEAAKSIQLQGRAGAGARFSENGEIEETVKKLNTAVEVKGGAERLINPLRWKKSEGEIKNMKATVAATAFAQQNAARAIKPGVAELEVEGVILAGFRKGGAVREGFPSIVGSGPNATVLHHFSSERKMQSGDMVVVDIGAEYNYYSADVTRTYPANGKFTPRQREIYQLVLDTQRACEKYVKPGVTTLGELHQYAAKFMRESPLRAKDRSGNEATMDRFFVHGLGHWLGMDVHDVSGRSQTLEVGTVFTIEPGIYIAGENIGVRIEDDYLVTADKLVKLSADIPSDVPAVEAAMRSGTSKSPVTLKKPKTGSKKG